MGIRPVVARRPGVFLTIIVALLAAYWWWGPLPGDGRLESGLGGTSALGAPPVDVWTATVGGSLCTSGDPVTIDDVAATTEGDVRDVSFQVLTMQPGDIRSAGAYGYGAARGAPPAFNESYAEGDPLPGEYVDAIEAEVVAPCSPGGAYDAAVSQSLLVVATVGPEGGRVGDVQVGHRSWGRTQTVGDDVGLVVVCGVEQTTRGCPGMAVDEQGRSVRR